MLNGITNNAVNLFCDKIFFKRTPYFQCPPGQICIDLVNDYECRCPPGYAGDDCSVDLDPCAKEPCINGTCVVDKTTHQFNCKCFHGYTGK